VQSSFVHQILNTDFTSGRFKGNSVCVPVDPNGCTSVRDLETAYIKLSAAEANGCAHLDTLTKRSSQQDTQICRTGSRTAVNCYDVDESYRATEFVMNAVLPKNHSSSARRCRIVIDEPSGKPNPSKSFELPPYANTNMEKCQLHIDSAAFVTGALASQRCCLKGQS
jgi:hypothetical protein